MKFRKIIATASAMLMLTSTMAMAVSAEETGSVPTVDGKYNAKVQAMRDGSTSLSMAAGIFIDQADISIAGDEVTIEVYITNPIPNFPTDGVTLSNIVLTDVNSVELPEAVYIHHENIENKPIRSSKDIPSPNFMGTEPNTPYLCDVMLMTVPTSVLNDSHINVEAYIELMGSVQEFDLVLSNYSDFVEQDHDDVSFGKTDITGQILPEPTYSVTIPQAIDLGVIDITKDIFLPYDISVDIESIEEGKQVTVSTGFFVPMLLEGTVMADNDVFSMANAFGYVLTPENVEEMMSTIMPGPISTTEDMIITSTIYQTHHIFDSLPAGNYAGSMNFTINYADIPVVENP